MPFSAIPSGGRIIFGNQGNATSPRTFPALSFLTKNAGDLLIAICCAYQSSAAAGSVFSAWSAGWTEFADLGGTTSNMSIGLAYRFSDGTETNSIQVTQAATITGHCSMFIISCSGNHESTPPECSAIAHGTTAAANPAAFDPAGWGAEENLWIAVGCAGETATAGAFDGMLGAPTNYSGTNFSGISGDVIGGTEAAVAFRILNASSEDVAGWNADFSNARNSAVLIAVRPSPVVPRIATVDPQMYPDPRIRERRVW